MEFSSSSLNLYHVNDYQMSFCILSLTTQSLHYESSAALLSTYVASFISFYFLLVLTCHIESSSSVEYTYLHNLIWNDL